MSDQSDHPQPGAGAPITTPPADTAGPQPTSGRRGVTIALVVLALAVIGGVIGLLSRENESHPVDDVASALASDAAQLAGPLNPTGLAHARCTAVEGEDELYSCTPVIDNATSKPITVEWKDDRLTKRLGGQTLTQAPRSGDDVAKALTTDEQATIGRTVDYGCAFTSGMNADGGAAANSPGGYRCVDRKTLDAKTGPIQRYVEFATDGSVTRDFMVTEGS
ncbi:MAG: hypothetical protein PGN13_05120 [Patulibacter minatonensis]